MRYIYERGKRRRVMHIATFTTIGQMLLIAQCGTPLDFDTSVNVPLGRRICKNCRRAINND